MPVSKRECLRLILASIISPSVPIIALSIASYGRVIPIFFIFGYLFFLLIGFPIIGFLLKEKRFFSCVIGGGSASIIPIILLNSFSLFKINQIFTLDNLFGYGSLFIAGCVGGAVFWLIAFFKERKEIKNP